MYCIFFLHGRFKSLFLHLNFALEKTKTHDKSVFKQKVHYCNVCIQHLSDRIWYWAILIL